MQRITPFEQDEYYHVYSRGVERRNIFRDDLDRSRFLLLMYLCNTSENIQFSKLSLEIRREKERNKSKPSKDDFLKLYERPKKDQIVSVIAYCLMPNHFHIVLKENTEGGISVFMQKLLTAYSMHFNKKYKRSGSLFVNPFKAKHIDTDNYFSYLVGYIHLNPVKIIDPTWKDKGLADLKKAKEFLLKYTHSSLNDYLSNFSKNRPEYLILDKKSIPNYLTGAKEVEDFLDHWLTYSSDYKDDEFFDRSSNKQSGVN